MDAFAQIAKEGIGGRTELLCVPPPPQPPTHSVTLECCSSSPTEAAPKMQTHAQLQDALQEMRQRYAPFLAEVAPALESMRNTVDEKLSTTLNSRLTESFKTVEGTQTGRKSLCRTTEHPLVTHRHSMRQSSR
jgi:hypothetical protein